MELDAYKELTPVVYGELSARFLAFSRQPGQECFRLHWHERMELLRIREGSMEIRIAEEKLTAKAGQLVLIYPCQPHYALAGEDGVTYDVIMFDLSLLQNGTMAGANYLQPIAEGSVTFANVTGNPDLVAAADGLLEMHRDREQINPLRITGEIYSLLGMLYERFPQNQRTVRHVPETFRPVVEYVNRNFTQPMTTAQLSRKFGYNESYFCRQFRKVTGLNAVRYIQILRLEHAQKLLRKGDKTLVAVATESGFSDIYHFTHCFSKHFKISPDAYRKACRRN